MNKEVKLSTSMKQQDEKENMSKPSKYAMQNLKGGECRGNKGKKHHRSNRQPRDETTEVWTQRVTVEQKLEGRKERSSGYG